MFLLAHRLVDGDAPAVAGLATRLQRCAAIVTALLVTEHAFRNRYVKVFVSAALPVTVAFAVALAAAVAVHWHATLAMLFTMPFAMMMTNVKRDGVQLGSAEAVPARIKASPT